MELTENIRLYNMDCMELLKDTPDNSIDLLLQDPPYNTTACDWEVELDFEALWKEWLRVCKPNAAMVFTAAQPFTTDLIMSNRKMFRYEWIWKKNRGNNFMNVKYMPFKEHENIIIFYKEKPTYNAQRIFRTEKSLKRKPIGDTSNSYSKNPKNRIHPTTGMKRSDKNIFAADGMRQPSSVIHFDVAKDRKSENKHQTAKPVELMRYLIRTYSNENDLVFDGYSGSGTTAIACIEENRKFLGAELNKNFFQDADNRIKNMLLKPKLF